MMNELLKIQQDMASPQHRQRLEQAAVLDEDAVVLVGLHEDAGQIDGGMARANPPDWQGDSFAILP